MLETVLGLSVSSIVGALGVIAAIVTIIVEVLKQIVPKKFPTKLLAILVSLIVCVLFVILFCEISFKTICLGIFMSFVASFVSMNGFDALKDIYDRFVINVKNSKGGEE